MWKASGKDLVCDKVRTLHLRQLTFYAGTYNADTMPVIKHYASLGKVAEVSILMILQIPV
jgi:hypothetical protein